MPTFDPGALQPALDKRPWINGRPLLKDAQGCARRSDFDRADGLVTRWLNENRDADPSIRSVVSAFSDALMQAQKDHARGAARDTVRRNLRTTARMTNSEHAEATAGDATASKKTHAFLALSKEGGLQITDMEDAKYRAVAAKHGITTFDAALIRIFTADDFRYINPAAGNNRAWLKASIKRGGVDDEGRPAETPYAAQTDTRLFEEGSLLTALVVDAMKKLTPATPSVAWRGQRMSPAELAQLTVGSSHPTLSLSSASLLRPVAAKFAALDGARNAAQSVAVLFEMTRFVGRDITELSLVKKEAEVALLPGTQFKVTARKKVAGPRELYDTAANYALDAKAMKQPVPTECWIVSLEGTVPQTLRGTLRNVGRRVGVVR